MAGAQRPHERIYSANRCDLWQRDGFLRGREVFNRAPARADLGRHRAALPRVHSVDRLALFPMDVSIVVPLFNERDNLAPLHGELNQVMQQLKRSYELIFVDDGSTDGGVQVLRNIK